MEERKPVKQVLVDYKCPKCNEGYLRPTGQVYTTYPPMYPHRCNNPKCDYSETMHNKAYPHIEYEEIDSSKPIMDTNVSGENK